MESIACLILGNSALKFHVKCFSHPSLFRDYPSTFSVVPPAVQNNEKMKNERNESNRESWAGEVHLLPCGKLF